jgi:hypothetical protein
VNLIVYSADSSLCELIGTFVANASRPGAPC